MNVKTLLERVTLTLAKVRMGGRRGDARLGALDRGILQVALMIAAIDGEILPAEYAAFENLAKRCRGYSVKAARQCLDAALRKAGYLMAMAQVGAYTEKQRVAAFLEMAVDALPSGFSYGSEMDVRRAFALWVAMGVSDGAFSELERKVVNQLKLRFAALKGAQLQAVSSLTMPHAEPAAPLQGVGDFAPLLDAHFLEKAECIVCALADASKREKAEKELEELIRA